MSALPKKKFQQLTAEEKLSKSVSAFPDMLEKWEESHPHWREETLLWILDWSLRSLRRYIESGDEKEISWESPFVELRLPIECEWIDPDTQTPSFRINTGTVKAADVATPGKATKTLSRLLVKHLEILTLQELTNHVALEKRGESMYPLLTSDIADYILASYPKEQQQHEVEKLFTPKSFGGGTVSFEHLEEGAEITDDELRQLETIDEPLIWLPIAIDGVDLRVITVFEVHPPVADPETKSGYFPIVVGLSVQFGDAPAAMVQNDDSLMWLELQNWPEKKRTALWKDFSSILKIALSELGPKPEPEMEAAVISVHAELKVMVPSGSIKQVNSAISTLLEHFNSTGELLSFKATKTQSDQGKCNSKLSAKIKAIENAKTTHEKGKALEDLLAGLFQTVEGFSVTQNVRTESEEIDLVVSNECEKRPFSDEGDVILVECKNWSGKCGKNEFSALYHKVLNRGGRCTLAYLVSWNGFAETITYEMLRSSREKTLIVPIEGADLIVAVKSGDFLNVLRTARKKALMV